MLIVSTSKRNSYTIFVFLKILTEYQFFPKALPELGFSFRFWGAGVGERSRRSAAVGRGSPRCAGAPYFAAQAQCFCILSRLGSFFYCAGAVFCTLHACFVCAGAVFCEIGFNKIRTAPLQSLCEKCTPSTRDARFDETVPSRLRETDEQKPSRQRETHIYNWPSRNGNVST